MWEFYILASKLILITTITISSLFLPIKRLNEVEIIIIGAGPSGIAAATRLMEHGFNNITILEAENRIGGRVNTIKFGDAMLELGSQWVHGEKGNVVYSMASQYNVLMESAISEEYGKKVFIDSNGNLVDSDLSFKLFNILNEITESTQYLYNYTGSLGQYFHNEYGKMLKKHSLEAESELAKLFLDWYHKAQNTMDAADSWFDTSGHGEAVYKECEGNQVWAWKSGYSTILDILMKRIPDALQELPVKQKTKLSTEVIKIKWDKSPENKLNKVVVETSNGLSFTANHVILSVSLGVLKERAESLFQPGLPEEKLTAIKGLKFGTVDKIFLKFPYRWWPTNINELNFLWTNMSDKCSIQEEEKNCWISDVFEFHVVDNQPLILCGWISGFSARYMETLSDEQVKKESYEIIKQFVGKALNLSIPEPDEILRSSWFSNPHFRGSYSYRSMETEEYKTSAAHLAKPLKNGNDHPVLLFSGEATHSYYYSTVHGAIETGWREAERIMRLYD